MKILADAVIRCGNHFQNLADGRAVLPLPDVRTDAPLDEAIEKRLLRREAWNELEVVRRRELELELELEEQRIRFSREHLLGDKRKRRLGRLQLQRNYQQKEHGERSRNVLKNWLLLNENQYFPLKKFNHNSIGRVLRVHLFEQIYQRGRHKHLK
jgi:hypothetical protein